MKRGLVITSVCFSILLIFSMSFVAAESYNIIDIIWNKLKAIITGMVTGEISNCVDSDGTTGYTTSGQVDVVIDGIAHTYHDSCSDEFNLKENYCPGDATAPVGSFGVGITLTGNVIGGGGDKESEGDCGEDGQPLCSSEEEWEYFNQINCLTKYGYICDLTYGRCQPMNSEEGYCDDGFDNDGNGATDEEDEACIVGCTPDCSNRECGLDPVCGVLCGTCLEGYFCDLGECFQENPSSCIDIDGDGYYSNCGLTTDCNDNDPTIYPGATEKCNSIDHDCDGRIYTQSNSQISQECNTDCGNGEQICTRYGVWGDCSAPLPTDETCNGADDDCDGIIDNNLVNPLLGTTCTTNKPGICSEGTFQCKGQLPLSCVSTIEPGETAEICGDGLDNDCMNGADNGCPCGGDETKDCGSDIGECEKGIQNCINGLWGDICEGEIPPTTEACNGKDDDCDDYIDEAEDNNLLTKSCGTVLHMIGICKQGYTICENGVWGSCQGNYIGPLSDEDCSTNEDDDCDGSANEGCSGCDEGDIDICGTNLGECYVGTQTCINNQWGSCEDSREPVEEICSDGLDNDCDGYVDEDCTCYDGSTRVCGSDIGECREGLQTCENDVWGECYGEIKPIDELCDGIDNNCDGIIDNNCDEEQTELPKNNEAPRIPVKKNFIVSIIETIFGSGEQRGFLRTILAMINVGNVVSEHNNIMKDSSSTPVQQNTDDCEPYFDYDIIDWVYPCGE